MEEDERGRRWEVLLPHRDAVVAAVRRRFGSSADAEACVHEALIRLVEKGTFALDHPRQSLLRATRNIAIDDHRRWLVAARRLAKAWDPRVVSAEDQALDRLLAVELLGKARTLSPLERAALVTHIDGKQPAHVAELLGVSPRSLHQAMFRARSILRRIGGAGIAVLVALRRQGHRGAAIIPSASLILAAVCLIVVIPAAAPAAKAKPSLVSAPAVKFHKGGAPTTPPEWRLLLPRAW